MTKSCPNCGTMNTKEASFCTGCGSNIQKIVSSDPAAHNTNQSNACLWCHKNAGFKEEEGKLDSKWGVTAHRMKIFICNNCGYAHLFGLGRSIWDFD